MSYLVSGKFIICEKDLQTKELHILSKMLNDIDLKKLDKQAYNSLITQVKMKNNERIYGCKYYNI